MLAPKLLAELGKRATARLAQAGDKLVTVPGPKGRKRTASAIDMAYVGVTPDEVLALCDQAQPADDESRRVVDDLRAGAAAANRNADEVYILAKDLAVLCAAAGYGIETVEAAGPHEELSPSDE